MKTKSRTFKWWLGWGLCCPKNNRRDTSKLSGWRTIWLSLLTLWISSLNRKESRNWRSTTDPGNKSSLLIGSSVIRTIVISTPRQPSLWLTLFFLALTDAFLPMERLVLVRPTQCSETGRLRGWWISASRIFSGKKKRWKTRQKSKSKFSMLRYTMNKSRICSWSIKTTAISETILSKGSLFKEPARYL